MVAAVSHLPHVVAAALVNTAASLEKRLAGTLSLAAGGFAIPPESLWGRPVYGGRFSSPTEDPCWRWWMS